MNRRVLALAVVAAALTGAAILFMTSERRSTVDSPAPAADALPERAPETPPEPAAPAPPAGTPPAARRPPAPAPAAEPEPAPVESTLELGVLRIDADVPGAQVFIDRQFVGTTPLTAENIAPGSHQLNVVAEGFEGIAQTIDVEPGPRDLTFRFREVRLDASLAVVHRHRMGSCHGHLVATPDGIRYETENTEDGFSAPLGDLETFQVDYQDKNLRIKLRRGRQYNFTDPDGNADRLFVFHREVEKVRARQ